MRDPAAFDAFYTAARDRLLLQTFALTGDLPAARGAVRDAFVAAWHHWRKVSCLEDPETWVRPHAWTHAQRRHTTRIWHRDKTLDGETSRTLDALAKLTLGQRKVLLLTHLCAVSLDEMAREVGLTGEAVERELQTATAQFSLHRDVHSTSVRVHLEALVPSVEGTRFPRATIIRRSGAARRRVHAGVGMVVAVAALFAAGAVAYQADGVRPALGGVSALGDPKPEPRQQSVVEPTTLLAVEDLLSADQIGTLAATRTVAAPVTTNNTDGTGINTVCQSQPFADPDGEAALVRKFSLSGTPKLKAIQSVELSADLDTAQAAYETVIGWYAGCTEKRAQLLVAHDLRGVGDEATLLVLRTWQEPTRTYTIGIARTGSLVTSVVRQITDARDPRLGAMVDLTATAVNQLCGHDDAGECSAKPRLKDAPPPPAEMAPGLLQVVDLPPVDGIRRPWAGTRPTKARENNAATSCDKASFASKKISQARTRTFVIPDARVPTTFGLTQTLGRFRSAAAAKRFVSDVRDRLGACEDKELSTRVNQVHTESDKSTEMTIWRLRTEVSEKRTVEFQMAIIRRGRVVVQLGFVPDAGHSIGNGAFHDLSERALERVENLPRK